MDEPNRTRLAAAAVGAATLAERLASPSAERVSDEVARERWAAWVEAVARGDERLFLERLRRDGLGEADARRACEGAGAPPGPWLDLLVEAVEAALAERGPDRAIDADKPLPFEEVLLPFVVVARARAGTDETHAALERALLEELSGVAAPTLHLELTARSAARPSLAFMLGRASEARDLHDELVSDLRTGGLVDLFEEWPVLGRLLATIAGSWIDTTRELFEWLARDRDAIARTFCEGRDPGRVVSIRPALGDRHLGGRQVTGLAFESGLELVVKPRGLALDVAWNGLLAWLEERGVATFRPRVLDRGDHGWVELVAAAPCESPEAGRRFYRRAGALVALGWLFGVNDLHLENLIAHGEHPVLVDLETILQPGEPWGEEPFADTVLTSGLLPGGGGLPIDASGLGAPDGQVVPSPEWVDAGSDGLRREAKAKRLGTDHLPRLADGTALALADHEDALLEGLRETLAHARDDRERLLAGPLEAFAAGRTRGFVRATRAYAYALLTLAEPRWLRDGFDRCLGLERLARVHLPPQDEALGERGWPIFAAEVAAIERHDVPVFWARGRDLELEGGRVVPGFAAASGLERARARLAALDEAVAALQAKAARAAITLKRFPTRPHAPPAAPSEPLAPFDRGAAIERARAIGRAIAASVDRVGGQASWLSASIAGDQDRFSASFLGPGLYDGAGGVALFLAALAATGGGDEPRALALEALAPWRRRLLDGRAATALARSLGHGATTGLPSVIVAWRHVARLLGDRELEADARALARHLDRAAIAHGGLDFLGGVAGTALVLLRLHGDESDPRALDLARACGERLLATQLSSGGWPGPGPTTRPLAGLTHGASGVAVALAELARATGERAFEEAARRALAFEATLFDPDARNWLDARSEARDPMNAWCHGAPGIALARLALGETLGDAVSADLEVALATTAGGPDRGQDQLCCGALGRASVLLDASRSLERPDLAEAARSLGARVLGRERPRLVTAHLPPKLDSPALFQGAAGIGYTLLRLAHEELPSITWPRP